MGRDFFECFPPAQKLFQAVDERLGENLSEICFYGPAELLGRTVYTQPAVLTTSLACLAALRESGIRPDYVAGHSLGEYTALAAAGVLDPVEAAWLVRRRGIYMEEAVPSGQGGMAAVLGLDQARVEDICRAAAKDGGVWVANLNSPGQVVISGLIPALEKAIELCQAAGAKRVVRLDVSGPFHSPLMESAVRRLAEDLGRVTWQAPEVPIIANYSARPVTEVSTIREALLRQLIHPVRWQESVEFLLSQGVDTFIEVGPGKVLSGLIKRIGQNVRTYQVEDRASLEKTLASL
jgi:[acyl-carrier-protein] S-malonyltransferase